MTVNRSLAPIDYHGYNIFNDWENKTFLCAIKKASMTTETV